MTNGSSDMLNNIEKSMNSKYGLAFALTLSNILTVCQYRPEKEIKAWWKRFSFITRALLQLGDD